MRSYSLWLIEDDAIQREHAISLLDSSSYASQLRITALDGTAELKEKLACDSAPDILLTDIDLGEETPTGVDLAESLFTRKRTRIIYATAYLNLVTSAYRTDHVYLLAKPVKLEELELALASAIDEIERESRDTLSFSFGSGIKRLATTQIMWLESSGHRVEIHTLDGTRETYDSLRNLAQKLPKSFIRAHKSYIVNLEHVDELLQNELAMTNGLRIPVSRKYRHEVHDALMAHLGLRV